MLLVFFFFNDTATTEIYTLSLHDALPISISEGPRAPARGSGAKGQPGGACDAQYRGAHGRRLHAGRDLMGAMRPGRRAPRRGDRKSTRLNSSHANISYAVFCLKKKNTYSN